MSEPQVIIDAPAAVRRFRQSLGETQEEFAHRMKRAIRTVARWETVRPPVGRELYALELESSRNGMVEWVSVFHRLLFSWLGTGESAPVSYNIQDENQSLRAERLQIDALLGFPDGLRIEHVLAKISYLLEIRPDVVKECRRFRHS